MQLHSNLFEKIRSHFSEKNHLQNVTIEAQIALQFKNEKNEEKNIYIYIYISKILPFSKLSVKFEGSYKIHATILNVN